MRTEQGEFLDVILFHWRDGCGVEHVDRQLRDRLDIFGGERAFMDEFETYIVWFYGIHLGG